MKEIAIVIGALMLYAYAIGDKKSTATGAVAPAVPPKAVGVADLPAIGLGGGGGSGGGSTTNTDMNSFPKVLNPSGGFSSPFDSQFFQQFFWQPSYRDQYPDKPGVVDASAL